VVACGKTRSQSCQVLPSFCTPTPVASGTHFHPSSEHFTSLALCFRCSAAKAADPAVTLASVKVLGLSGDVTVMSKAAGLPKSSQGPEHQQVVYDVGYAQDHSLLQHFYYYSTNTSTHIHHLKIKVKLHPQI